MRPLDFADLMMVDDIVPSDFSPFRTIEYEHYLKFFNAALLSLEGWQAWIGNESFGNLLERFPIDRTLKSRIVPFRTHANIVARLAYVTFLGNAIRLVAFFEGRGIPFILQLYPGGGFEVDRPDTDEKLRRVLLSKFCRKVIVTQSLTERYIVDKIGCNQAKVEHIFGGVFESRLPFSFDRDKVFYPRGKETIDLCFVAHKYGENITSKGYDQFVAIALELAGALGHLRFHVVGDYLPGDVPLEEFSSRFTFYGRRSSAFLADFYRSMDMIISINRPFDLTPGSFDGFPTGACIEAGFRGVLNCINDPLNLNPCLIDSQDIVLLNLDHQSSAARLRDLIKNPPELYRIAERGWHRFLDVFDTNRQLWARTRVIAAELTRHEGLIVRPAPDASVLDSGSFRQVLLPYRERIALLEAANNQLAPITGAVPESDQIAQYDTEALRTQVTELANQLNIMKSSTSWRLTAPLRRILHQYPKLAFFLRRGIKLIWWTLSLQLASRYRAWSAVHGGFARHQPAQRRLFVPTAEGDARSRPMLPQPQTEDEAVATTEKILSGNADRIDSLDASVAKLLREIRWDQTRTDFALGAIEGLLEDVGRFQIDRQLADYECVFQQTEPLVSVCVVATAERADLLLERSVSSILAQTYRNLQIVIVGDHCTDDTGHKLAQLRDNRISFTNLPERGPYPRLDCEQRYAASANAKNAALAQCQGHFITHLDDCDRFASNRIERLVRACLAQRVEFCWHPFRAQRDAGDWEVIGDGQFSVDEVNSGAVFYHRYFTRFEWDPLGCRLNEPEDWNRFRKIKMLRPKMLFFAEPLLNHYQKYDHPPS
jgi:glycosyltransferase involved in cell wall biosynthesis